MRTNSFDVIRWIDGKAYVFIVIAGDADEAIKMVQNLSVEAVNFDSSSRREVDDQVYENHTMLVRYAEE